MVVMDSWARGFSIRRDGQGDFGCSPNSVWRDLPLVFMAEVEFTVCHDP
jgi:hypothetical protein